MVSGERHVAAGGKTRRVPAIIGLRQPLQPEFEFGEPPLGLGAREMPGSRPLDGGRPLLWLDRRAGSLRCGLLRLPQHRLLIPTLPSRPGQAVLKSMLSTSSILTF